MNNFGTIMASLSFVASATTLVIVIVGAKKMNEKGREIEAQVNEAKAKANRAVSKAKMALDDLEM